VNFLEQQEAIVDFIKDRFGDYLQEYDLPNPHYVSDYLDFDLYKFENTVFFDFGMNQFEQLTYQSMSQTIYMTQFIVVRDRTPGILRKDLLNYTTQMYKMFADYKCNFKDGNAQGLVDIGKIEGVTFYEVVFGQKNLKVSQIDYVLNVEV
jgi:hypothetical protein